MFWVIGALILSLLISFRWQMVPRLIFCCVVCVIGCAIPIIPSNHYITLTFVVELQDIQEVNVYRSQRDSVTLNETQIEEMTTMFENLDVKEDIMEKSLNMVLNN